MHAYLVISVDDAEISMLYFRMLARPKELDTVVSDLSLYHVVAIVGARQVGETLARTIARRWRRGPVTLFDLQA